MVFTDGRGGTHPSTKVFLLIIMLFVATAMGAGYAYGTYLSSIQNPINITKQANQTTERNITDPKYLSTITGVEDIEQFDIPTNRNVAMQSTEHVVYFKYSTKGYYGKTFHCFITRSGGISCTPEYQSVI